MDEKPVTRFLKPTGECDHEMCGICIKNMITSSLRNVTTDIPLKCPYFDQCGKYIMPTIDIKNIIGLDDFTKFERYTLTKVHIPVERLRYCTNSECEMPYELIDDDIPTSPLTHIDYRYFLSCFTCNTNMCILCNTNWHEGISCKESQHRISLRDNRESENEIDSNNYIENYCKKCPKCNVVVQKLQTPEQERHETISGMAGGTAECHHVTCSNCKVEFCWTCMGIYQDHMYYHPECPNVDCIINFMGNYPRITHLPVGRIKYIKMIVYENDTNIVITDRIYNSNGLNHNSILDNLHASLSTETVFLHCNQNGIVRKLEGLSGLFTFRQNSRVDLCI